MLLILQYLKVIKVQLPKPYKISSSYNLRMKTILNIITYGQANLYRKIFPTQKLQSTTPPSSLQHLPGSHEVVKPETKMLKMHENI